jgi:hypothetical protein
MSSKDLVVKGKEVTLPAKAYNPEIDKVTAETHYRTPFNHSWLTSTADVSLEQFSMKPLTALTGSALGFALSFPLDMMVLNPGVTDPGVVISSVVITGFSMVSGLVKYNRKKRAKLIAVKTIIKEHFPKWLEERYSIEVENVELDKLVNHITFYSGTAYNDLHFISSAGNSYVLKSFNPGVWYVEPYAEPVELTASEQLAYTPAIAKVLEPKKVNRTNKFNAEQQNIHNSITDKLSVLKSIDLDTEKTFNVNRINADLRDISKLNDYGNTLALSNYDSSKVTTLLTLLDKELSAIFKEELRNLETSFNSKIELITSRMPQES